MFSRIVVCLVIIVLLSTVAESQQPDKIPRIGYLSLRQGIEPREEAFQKGLRELGYVEGKNIVIEWRFAQGRADLLPQLATELVQLKPDVIVAAGTQAVRTLKQITSTIPVVIGQVGTRSSSVSLRAWRDPAATSPVLAPFQVAWPANGWSY